MRKARPPREKTRLDQEEIRNPMRQTRESIRKSQPLNSQTITPQHLPVLMTPDQVADLLMVSPRTLAGWRLRGKGPKFVRLGNKGRELIRYRSSVILAWIESNERQTTEGNSSI